MPGPTWPQLCSAPVGKSPALPGRLLLGGREACGPCVGSSLRVILPYFTRQDCVSLFDVSTPTHSPLKFCKREPTNNSDSVPAARQ